MNERRIGIWILALLLCLNLCLFGYDCYLRLQANWIPSERIEQIETLYRQANVEIGVTVERQNPPRSNLLLGEADLDQMAETYLEKEGDIYDKSYIYGSKVQYSSGDRTILTDRSRHMIAYADTSERIAEGQKVMQGGEEGVLFGETEDEAQMMEALMPLARDFAQKWLGREVHLTGSEKTSRGYRFGFCQMDGETALYFNEVQVCVIPEGIAEAVITYWQVEGESEKSRSVMPLDEVLFALLSDVRAGLQEDSREEVVRILDGYLLQETPDGAEAVPSVTVVVSSGQEYTLCRTVG